LNKFLIYTTIILLSTSLFTFTIPSSSGLIAEPISNSFDETQKITVTNHHNVILNESINIKSDDQSQSNDVKNTKPKVTTTKHISLTEKVSLSLDVFDGETSGKLKDKSEQLAILERITDRQKSKLKESEKVSVSFSNLEENQKHTTQDSSEILNPLKNLELIDEYYVSPNLELISVLLPNDRGPPIDYFSSELTDPNYSSLHALLLFIPIVGTVLVSSEKSRIQFYEFKKLFSYVFVIILLSSATITPFSISSSYWGMAYAEEFSFEGIIDDSANVTAIVNATATEPIVNATATN